MKLKPEEASKLGLIAQFAKLKRARKDIDEMIATLSPQAKKVAHVLLGGDPSSVAEGERVTAEAYKGWHNANVRIGSRLAQRAGAGSRPANARRRAVAPQRRRLVESKTVNP